MLEDILQSLVEIISLGLFCNTCSQKLKSPLFLLEIQSGIFFTSKWIFLAESKSGKYSEKLVAEKFSVKIYRNMSREQISCTMFYLAFQFRANHEKREFIIIQIFLAKSIQDGHER